MGSTTVPFQTYYSYLDLKEVIHPVMNRFIVAVVFGAILAHLSFTNAWSCAGGTLLCNSFEILQGSCPSDNNPCASSTTPGSGSATGAPPSGSQGGGITWCPLISLWINGTNCAAQNYQSISWNDVGLNLTSSNRTVNVSWTFR